MKEKKRIGHDDRINLQAAIAKGWTLAQAAPGFAFLITNKNECPEMACNISKSLSLLSFEAVLV